MEQFIRQTHYESDLHPHIFMSHTLRQHMRDISASPRHLRVQMNKFIYSHSLRPLRPQTLVREATLEMIKTWLKGELAPTCCLLLCVFQCHAFQFVIRERFRETASAPFVLLFLFGDQYFLLWWTLYVQKLCFLSRGKCILHMFTSAGSLVSVHTTASIWPAHHYSDAMWFFPLGSTFCVI